MLSTLWSITKNTLFLIACIMLVAFITKPSNESFNDYTKNNLLVGSPLEKDIVAYFITKQTIIDFSFFKLGVVNIGDKNLKLFGIFNNWIFISGSTTNNTNL